MDQKWTASVAGGDVPVWDPRGESIFFVDLDGRLLEARVHTEPSFSVERPQVVLEGSWGLRPNHHFDILPDGERFLLIKTAPQEDITELVVVENWFDLLKQKAPPGKTRSR